MTTTVIKADLDEAAAPVLLELFITAAGQVAPNAAGYALALTEEWLYEAEVDESCVGIYRVLAKDGDGGVAGQGYVLIEADDAGPYFADASYVMCDTLMRGVADVAAIAVTLAEVLTDTGTTLPATLATAIADIAAVKSDTATAVTQTAVAALRTAMFAGGDVDGKTLEESLKIIAAAVAGKVSGGGTATNVFRAIDDSKDRITSTVDAGGNRTAVTLDATG